MKEQTFVSRLEDEQGRMIDFERWNFKRLSKVEESVKQLYGTYTSTYKDELIRAASIVFYEAPGNENYKEVKRIPHVDFNDYLGLKEATL